MKNRATSPGFLVFQIGDSSEWQLSLPLLQIFLVIFFCAIEGAGRSDFGYHGPLELSARLQRPARDFLAIASCSGE
jgi:hypothetical protein